MDNSAAAVAIAPKYSVAYEAVPLRERGAQLLYAFILLLGFITLYAMAETRSLESRTVHYLPPADIHAVILTADGVLTDVR